MKTRFAFATAVLLTLPLGFTSRSVAQHMETSGFNAAPVRPKEDPAVVARGKAAYEKQCQQCHAADLRGAQPAGPNILRSQYSLTDKKGEVLLPVMLGQSPEFPSHKIAINTADANAVAAYIRTLVGQIGSQGRPPGESSRSPNVLVGDATRGQQYFTAHCSTCHSAEGDLKGFGKRLGSPKPLQAAWLRGTHLGVTPPPITATATQPGKAPVEGTVIHIDDFYLTLKLQDGSMLTVRRDGDMPRVVVHDPLQAHRDMLPKLKDSDIHDVTAYLVTLK